MKLLLFRSWFLVLGSSFLAPTLALGSSPLHAQFGPTPASPQPAASPDQVARWNTARLRPEKSIALDKAVFLFRKTAPRYAKIEAMRDNGVPAPVLFCLH